MGYRRRPGLQPLDHLHGLDNLSRYDSRSAHDFAVPSLPFLEGICAGPDGAMWFTEYGGNKIGRITTAGAITEFPIPTADTKPVSITSGPDGNLWFAEFGARQIGRITSSGTVTEFPSPFSTNNEEAIGPGPDGRIWFTLRYEPYIAAITTAGVVTKVPIPSRSDAKSLTIGPDNALWYTEPTAKKVARLIP